MDDLIAIVIYCVIALCVLACVFFVGTLAAICVFGAGMHGIVMTLFNGVRQRGGAGAKPGPGEPAFRAYYRSQVWVDLKLALATGRRRAHEERLRIESAVPGRAGGAATLFRLVMRLYGWYAFLLGSLVAIPVVLVVALLVALIASVAWLVGAPLRVAERVRRRIAGAHYDCGVCHTRFPLPVHVCPECGARHRALVPGRFGALRRRCECGAILPTLQLNGRQHLPAECPELGHPLGEAVGAVRTLHVPVAAGPSAGKTTFLAAALLELETRSAAGTMKTSIQKSSRDAYDRLLHGFRTGVLPAKTPDTMSPALVAEIRGAAKSALLHAYDVAGEAYSDEAELRRDPGYGLADGVVLLIDPLSLPGVRSAHEGEIGPALAASSEAPQRVLERLAGVLAEKGVDLRKVPIALCVTKVDALGLEAEIASAGSGDDAERVRAWLLDVGAGNLVRSADTSFGDVRGFKLSALGRGAGEGSGPFTPRGPLEPLLWLLRKSGIEPAAGGVADTTTSRLTAAPARSYRPRRPRSTSPIDSVAAGGYFANFFVGLLALTAIGAVFAGFGGVSTAPSGMDLAATAGGASDVPVATASPVAEDGGTSAPADDGFEAGTSSEEAEETPTPAPTPKPKPRRPAGAADSVVKRHFRRIDSGDYSGAYALMSKSYQARNPRWMDQPSQAQPRIKLASVGRPQIDGDQAWVRVKFYAADTFETASSDTRCRRFQGLVHLVRENGRWRYDPMSNQMDKAVLSSSLRACP